MESSLRRHQVMAKTKDHSCNFCVLAHTTENTADPATERQPATGGGVEMKLQSLETQLNLLARRLSETGSVSASSSSSREGSEKDTTSPSPSVSHTSHSSGSEKTAPSSTSKRKGRLSPARNLPGLPFAFERHAEKPTSACYPILLEHYSNVLDPLLKIVPLKTARLVYASHEEDLPSNALALRWSICFASAATMHQESQDTISRLLLWKPYAVALESSLTGSGFWTKPSIETIQALATYLICGQQVLDQIYVWSLTALLVRLAMKLKLHLDPDAQGLPTSECEYRRRLWWHICSLDASIAEAHDTDPLIYERQSTTRMPIAIPDTVMNGSADLASPTKQHCSDMLYSMIRFEITYYVRTILFSEAFTEGNAWPTLSPDGKLSVIASLEQTLKDKYWNACTCHGASCGLAIYLSRALISALKLKIMLQSTELARTQSDTMVIACVTILDAARTLRTGFRYTKWIWLWPDDLEWYAATMCLLALRDSRPTAEASARAWTAFDVFLDNWKDSNRASERSKTWTNIKRLKAEARKAEKSNSLGRGQHNRRRSKAYSMVEPSISTPDGHKANVSRKCSNESQKEGKRDLIEELETIFEGPVRINAFSLML